MNIKKLVVPSNENEIKKHWEYIDKIYISCVCLTFNQKDYIRDTIDSFLAQETAYRFEIIIHDDVSTDGTRNILLEYKNKYPSIIKLVLQDENQYSQGKRIAPLAVEHADGEYIALCEGDDFWIDKYKLQKQIVELENNKDINICFTAAYGLDPKKNISKLCDYKKNQIFKFDDVILGGGAFMPTASLMIRKKIFDKLPDWFFTHAPVGDYFIQMLASQDGAIYINNSTLIYRVESINSWSRNHKKLNQNDLLNMVSNFLYCMNKINTITTSNNIIDRVVSIELTYYACIALKLGYYDLFYNFISKSWNKNKFSKWNQTLLYILRKKPDFISFLIK